MTYVNRYIITDKIRARHFAFNNLNCIERIITNYKIVAVTCFILENMRRAVIVNRVIAGAADNGSICNADCSRTERNHIIAFITAYISVRSGAVNGIVAHTAVNRSVVTCIVKRIIAGTAVNHYIGTAIVNTVFAAFAVNLHLRAGIINCVVALSAVNRCRGAGVTNGVISCQTVYSRKVFGVPNRIIFITAIYDNTIIIFLSDNALRISNRNFKV